MIIIARALLNYKAWRTQVSSMWLALQKLPLEGPAIRPDGLSFAMGFSFFPGALIVAPIFELVGQPVVERELVALALVNFAHAAHIRSHFE